MEQKYLKSDLENARPRKIIISNVDKTKRSPSKLTILIDLLGAS